MYDPMSVSTPAVRPRGFSIFHKLVGLAVAIIASVVTALTAYAMVYRREEMAVMFRDRAASAAAVGAEQARSAVAFADRETAREVLATVGGAPDVAGLVLYDEHGGELYRAGHPSPALARAAAGVREPRVVEIPGRIAAVHPVRSLEGPWGTLVIELSTARLEASQRRAIGSSVMMGAGAMLLAMFAMWLWARSLTRRLRAVASVATAVAGGDLDRRAVVDRSPDEIGVMARAFGAMLEQLAHAQHDLEARVVERTAALVESKRELEREMADRARMEVELRQAQKLEAVGRLAAGVAHEINTPIQFVADSCTFLQDAVRDVGSLLGSYRTRLGEVATGAVAAEAAIAELAAAEDRADAGYLLDEIPKAVARSIDGLDRVATIVRSLKEFAHPERQEGAPADLNRAIASTLTIARNEYKYIADVRTEFGELPPVDCHIGALNQAVLNIIVNGAHAIEAAVAGTERRGEIVVTTARDGDDAVITIADTGTGIPREILGKIFDPFFTTKEVGKGTGQGLALVHSVVVDQHHGRIEVDTEVGKGTTFRLRLPLGGTAEPAAAAA